MLQLTTEEASKVITTELDMAFDESGRDDRFVDFFAQMQADNRDLDIVIASMPSVVNHADWPTIRLTGPTQSVAYVLENVWDMDDAEIAAQLEMI